MYMEGIRMYIVFRLRSVRLQPNPKTARFRKTIHASAEKIGPNVWTNFQNAPVTRHSAA